MSARNVGSAIVLVALASIAPPLSGQQAERVPTLATGVAAPQTQPHRPSAQRPSPTGIIEGFVYWDANTIKHSPPNSCSGLSVTVSSGGRPLVTMTDNFAYMGNAGTDAACRYAVKGVPVEQDLEVQANVASPAAFSPPGLPSGGSKSINIMGGNALCNNLPPAVPSPSVLSANWWTCPNYAYNVNFVLVSARGLTPMGTRAPAGGPGPRAVELSPQPYPPKNGTLLGPESQKTLLGTQTSSPSTDGSKSALIPAVHRPPEGGFHWILSDSLVQALRRDVRTSRGAGAPNSAIFWGSRKQGGDTSKNGLGLAANARTPSASMIPGNGVSQIQPEQTMSASGSNSSSAAVAGSRGSASLAPGNAQTQSNGGAEAKQSETASQYQGCPPNGWGISGVNGHTAPGSQQVVFRPEPQYNSPPYHVGGCGFGSRPGQVWLTNVPYQPESPSVNYAKFAPLHRDWVRLNVFNKQWNNHGIDVVVDPNTSGFTNSLTAILLVITADGQQYQLPYCQFFPVRVEQKLDSIAGAALMSEANRYGLTSGGAAGLVQVTDPKGNPVKANFLSPSNASLVLPGHTLAVVREDSSAAFPGSTDNYDFTGWLWISHVDLFHADLTSQACQPATSFSTNGNWLYTWTAKGSPEATFTISWQEQACVGPNSVGSVSAYALDIYAYAPRGVSPWNAW